MDHRRDQRRPYCALVVFLEWHDLSQPIAHHRVCQLIEVHRTRALTALVDQCRAARPQTAGLVQQTVRCRECTWIGRLRQLQIRVADALREGVEVLHCTDLGEALHQAK
jgi:hypothetical protein